MLLTVGLSETCPKSVPPNQVEMPRLWATLPILEASFMDRPFVQAYIAASCAPFLWETIPFLSVVVASQTAQAGRPPAPSSKAPKVIERLPCARYALGVVGRLGVRRGAADGFI